MSFLPANWSLAVNKDLIITVEFIVDSEYAVKMAGIFVSCYFRLDPGLIG